ncbi:hypothetical protein BKA56DRAFT_131574 [Ilyonectria sp. MPI-CAGE-AT-0026]|nr:hypothetical protein BKA56DRAFT_131574 [Ilyonectria sp. MPI-CAGE-AT-0026]
MTSSRTSPSMVRIPPALSTCPPIRVPRPRSLPTQQQSYVASWLSHQQTITNTSHPDWPEDQTEAAQGSGETKHLWEESWDDDDTTDDFSAQLKWVALDPPSQVQDSTGQIRSDRSNLERSRGNISTTLANQITGRNLRRSRRRNGGEQKRSRMGTRNGTGIGHHQHHRSGPLLMNHQHTP